MASLDDRVRRLEDWQRDHTLELREWEEWARSVKPFLEQLQADLIYRQRRHAEAGAEWSTFAKIVAVTGGALIAMATVGGFVLQVIALSQGHG